MLKIGHFNSFPQTINVNSESKNLHLEFPLELVHLEEYA
jgi:hypothetical protein